MSRNNVVASAAAVTTNKLYHELLPFTLVVCAPILLFAHPEYPSMGQRVLSLVSAVTLYIAATSKSSKVVNFVVLLSLYFLDISYVVKTFDSVIFIPADVVSGNSTSGKEDDVEFYNTFFPWPLTEDSVGKMWKDLFAWFIIVTSAVRVPIISFVRSERYRQFMVHAFFLQTLLFMSLRPMVTDNGLMHESRDVVGPMQLTAFVATLFMYRYLITITFETSPRMFLGGIGAWLVTLMPVELSVTTVSSGGATA